jgi:hypothetical protein
MALSVFGNEWNTHVTYHLTRLHIYTAHVLQVQNRWSTYYALPLSQYGSYLSSSPTTHVCTAITRVWSATRARCTESWLPSTHPPRGRGIFTELPSRPRHIRGRGRHSDRTACPQNMAPLRLHLSISGGPQAGNIMGQLAITSLRT